MTANIRTAPNVVPVNFHQKWKVTPLAGGRIPVRGTVGAAGYDIFTRAIVSLNKDSNHEYMRETLYDFDRVYDKSLYKNISTDPETREPSYVLRPGESARIGVGFIMEMPTNLMAFVLPRGSTANRSIDPCNAASLMEIELFDPHTGLKVQNGRVPIDSDYRGEASAFIMNRGNNDYHITKFKRIVQLVLVPVSITHPIVGDPIEVGLSGLTRTKRGCGQNGHTGNGPGI